MLPTEENEEAKSSSGSDIGSFRASHRSSTTDDREDLPPTYFRLAVIPQADVWGQNKKQQEEFIRKLIDPEFPARERLKLFSNPIPEEIGTIKMTLHRIRRFC